MCDGLPGNISWGNRARSGRWPQNCSRLAVGSTCEGICNKGFAADPVPIATCVPPSKSQPYATWELKGACRDDVCSSPNVEAIIGYGDWPYTCDQSAVGANCTAVCWEGYDGDPTPVAVCTKPRENLTRAEWVVYFPDGCKDSTACRDDPCQHIDSAVAGSCIATPGEQPSAPGSGQFACTCFDDHKWDAATKACTPASLLVFAVTQPVDGAQRRRAAGQVPEASWIYMYGASKAADIGNATWVAQDTGTSAANLYAVAVADASTAWAVGSQGIIKRYDGRQWAVERPPTAGASTLHAVAALAGEDSLKAWAGGADGFALYYDGTSWSNVSVNAGQQINDIAAVVEPGGVETVWAVAGDERNPNKLMGYIYKWDAQAESWGTPSEFANITLRGLTALDRYGAWAVGFTNRGAATSRGIVMTWRHASQDWTRDDVYLPVDGYARLNSITAVNYGLLSIAGYFEKTGASGTVSTGLIAYLSYLPDFVRFHDGVIYSGGAVARFNDIAGLSPNTTVAVGSFTEEVAHGPPDNSSGLDWGYPAVLWLDSFPPRVERQEAVSIAYDQEVVGVGMQYVKV